MENSDDGLHKFDLNIGLRPINLAQKPSGMFGSYPNWNSSSIPEEPKPNFNLSGLLSSEYYPLVYIPEKILLKSKDELIISPTEKQIKDLFFKDLPQVPSEPRPPILQNINQVRIKYVTQKTFPFSRFISRFFLVFIFVFFLFWLVFAMFDYVNYFTILISPAIISLLIIPSFSKEVEIKKEIPLSPSEKEDVAKHNLNEQSWYNSKLESYKKDMVIFNTKYSQFLKQYKLKYALEKYRAELKAFPSNRTKASIRKGASELSFLEILNRQFGSSIMIDVEVPTFNSAYYPDFVYVSNNHGFCIDIEIDEPYEKDTNKPIHYIGSDDKRNNYFLEKNWIIIRFTENQVLTFPDDCSKYIQDVINKLENPHIYPASITSSIPRVRRWTYEEVILNKIN